MNKRDIQDALRRAADQLPRPDADYAATAPVQRLEVHDHITRQVPVLRRPRRRWIPALAVLVLVAVGVGLWYWWQNLMPWSTVTLSVNPAFAVSLNQQDTVLQVTAASGDAEALLEGRSYRGWSLEPALLALLGDLEQAGYDTASAAVTADSQSADRATVLELRCQELLASRTNDGQPDPEPPATPSPAPGVTPSAAPNATPAPTVSQPEPTHHTTDAPVGWARLSPREAKDIVLAREPSADIHDWKLEEDNDMWYYELEVLVNGVKYDVEIQAVTGEVLLWELDD